MTDRQPKPQANGQKQKRETEQIPKTKLQIVWTLDGVTAESLLIYKNKPVKSSLGKTRFHPSENVQSNKVSSPRARHQQQVRQSARGIAPNQSQHEEMVARKQFQKERTESRDREIREITPKKEQAHERK